MTKLSALLALMVLCGCASVKANDKIDHTIDRISAKVAIRNKIDTEWLATVQDMVANGDDRNLLIWQKHKLKIYALYKELGKP